MVDKDVIRVLHVIPTLSGGGAERQLVNVVSNTSREDFDHRVCILRNENFYLSEKCPDNVKVITLGLKGKYPWLAGAGRIRRLIRECRPDVIHSWLFDGDISARLAQLFHRPIPLITSLQSVPYEPETIKAAGLSPAKVLGLRKIDSWTARLTDTYFVACSKFVAGSAEKWLGVDSSRIEVIYNSVDTSTLRCDGQRPAGIRRELCLNDDDFVFLGVGRLDEGKGFGDLIAAFKGVAEHSEKVRLVIVGKGALHERLDGQIGSLGLRGKVVLAGERRDVGCCLEMADAFVFPTRFEGLGIALIEAMSKGLPCIASKLPVLEEVIDHRRNGLLVEAGNRQAWEDAMIELYNDTSLRDSFGQAARKAVSENFMSCVLMPKWERLYRSLANG